tara:strand:- start:259 stop:1470 length:1212 start_codon:yes stop_codon:yes gene_type:complete
MENEEVKDSLVEEVQQDVVDQEVSKPVAPDDGVIRVDLRDLKNTDQDAIQEQSTDASVLRSTDESAESGEETNLELQEVVEENTEQRVEDVRSETPVVEEITEEEVQEQTEQLTEQVVDAIEEQKQTGVDLPENVQKVVDFINDTGGTLEDYVKLNQDYSKLNSEQLLREYYETTKPHLDKEDIDLLMEDFSYDEELDDERDVRKRKIAFKEELAKAQNHMEGLKSKYYDEIKAGSRLTPDQQKAVEFFNRYNKENEEASKIAESQKTTFLKKTNDLFNNGFKGFEYSVGDKKYRFNVKDVENVKSTQSDINNFVKKFLNENNEMSDAKGYHKSLFTAMNADKIAQHFYEQGKADAIKDSVARSKNVDMEPRRGHEKTTTSNGWSVRAVKGNDVSDFKIKIRK